MQEFDILPLLNDVKEEVNDVLGFFYTLWDTPEAEYDEADWKEDLYKNLAEKISKKIFGKRRFVIFIEDYLDVEN